MSVLIFVILAVACLTNAIGDGFMLYGVRFTQWKPGVEALSRTPDAYPSMECPVRLADGVGLVLVGAHHGRARWEDRVGDDPRVLRLCRRDAGLPCVLRLRRARRPSAAVPYGAIRPVGPHSSGHELLVGSGGERALGGGPRGARRALGIPLTSPVVTIVGFQKVLGRVLGTLPYALVVAGPLAMLRFFAGFLSYANVVGAP